MEGLMTRLLLAIMAAGFVCATANMPASARYGTKEQCLANCPKQCTGVNNPTKCQQGCALRCGG
jgi:hypothetical protein